MSSGQDDKKFISYNTLFGILISMLIMIFFGWAAYVQGQVQEVPLLNLKVSSIETDTDLINRKLDAIGARLQIPLPNK